MATTRRLLVLLLAATATSCGGGSGGGDDDTSAAVDSTTPGDTGGSDADRDTDAATADTTPQGCGIPKPAGAPCNPYPGCDSGCPSGEVCTNVTTATSDSVACHATDGVAVGGACDHVNGPFCADGACVRNECRQFCDKNADCDNDTDCRSYQSGDYRINVCGASIGIICDPFQPNVECGAGTSCYRDVVVAKSSCLADGAASFGAACDCAECCAPGLTCARNSDSETGVCGQNCVAGGPGDRGCASRCDGFVPWRPLHDANTVAFCVPFESYPIANVSVGGSAAGTLAEIGEYDVFRFSGTAGQVVNVSLTTPGPAFNTDGIDAVVSVHRASDGKVVALADNAIFASSLDSTVLTVLPDTGSYYILVRDCFTYAGERPDKDYGCYPPVAKSQKSYTIAVGDMSSLVTVDAETGDDGANATTITLPRSGGNYGGVVALGTYRDAADVDVYQVTIPADLSLAGLPGQTYRAELAIRGFHGGVTGPYGSGSTSQFGEVSLTTASAPTAVIARLTDADEDAVIRVPVQRGETYLLWVTAGRDPAPTGGERDFYFIAVAPDRSFALETGSNDTLETAEAPKEVYTDDKQDVFQFAGDLSPDGDVDYYTFPITSPKRKIDVVCWASGLGSGLASLTATLLETNGTPVANGSASDSPTRPAVLTDRFTLAASTAVVLEVKATGTAPDTSARHYECQVILGVPTPAD